MALILNSSFNSALPESATNQRYIFDNPSTQVINSTTGETAAQAQGLQLQNTLQAIPNITPSDVTATMGAYYSGQNATSYVPPTTATPTISSTTLNPPASTNYQTPTPSPYYPVSTLSTPTAPPTGAVAPDFSLTPPQQQESDLIKSVQDLNNSLVGKSAYQTEQEQLAGVPGYQKTINDLGAQLTGLKNEAAAIPLQLQQGAADRGVTTPVLGVQENSRLRTNAIAALGVSTLLAAAQGNLANAQSLADKAVAQKYGPIEEQIKASLANLDLIAKSPESTQAEKQQAFQQQQFLQQQSAQIAQDKQNYSDVLKVGTEAASNIANFTPTAQYPSAAVALQAITQAKTPQDALVIATATGLTNSTKIASAQAPKILGNSTTGYFKYDPQTGQTTPISATEAQQPQSSAPTSIPSAQVTALKSALNASKFQGAEADGKYADPNLYLANYNSWVQGGGDPQTFFAAFPPKTYINPANTWLPPEIMRFVTG